MTIDSPNGPQHSVGEAYTLADQNVYGQERYIAIADGFGTDGNGVKREGYDSGLQTPQEYQADLERGLGTPNSSIPTPTPTLPIKPLSPVAQNQIVPTIQPISPPTNVSSNGGGSEPDKIPLRARIRGFFNTAGYK